MKSERIIFIAAIVLSVAALAFLLVGCADPIKVGRISLSTVTRLQTEAAKALVDYDKIHQLEIVKLAKSEVEGRASLDAYRKQRGDAVKAFSALYLATVATEKSFALAELAKDKNLNTASVVKELFDAYQRLAGILTVMGVPLGGGL